MNNATLIYQFRQDLDRYPASQIERLARKYQFTADNLADLKWMIAIKHARQKAPMPPSKVIQLSELEKIVARICPQDYLCSITIQSLMAVLSGYWEAAYLKAHPILDEPWGKEHEPIPSIYSRNFSFYGDKSASVEQVIDAIQEQLLQNSCVLVLIYFATLAKDILTHGFALCRTDHGLKIIDSYMYKRPPEIRDFDLEYLRQFLLTRDIQIWNQLFSVTENINLQDLLLDVQVIAYRLI